MMSQNDSDEPRYLRSLAELAVVVSLAVLVLLLLLGE